MKKKSAWNCKTYCLFVPVRVCVCASVCMSISKHQRFIFVFVTCEEKWMTKYIQMSIYFFGNVFIMNVRLYIKWIARSTDWLTTNREKEVAFLVWSTFVPKLREKKATTIPTNLLALALIPTHECTEKVLIGIELEYPNPVLLPFDQFLFVHTLTLSHTLRACMHALCVAAAIAFSQIISMSYITIWAVHKWNGAELQTVCGNQRLRYAYRSPLRI